MERMGEVKKAWALMKRTLGGIRKVEAVEVGPEYLRAYGSGQVVEVSPALVSLDYPVEVEAKAFDAAIKPGAAKDRIEAVAENGGLRIGSVFIPGRLLNKDRTVEAVEGPAHKYRGDTVRAVSVFASKDDARPVLGAVAFDSGEICATDSYRLAVEAVEGGPDETLLIPAGPLAAIAGAVDWVSVAGDSERVKVAGVIRATGGRVEYRGPGVRGQFPKYRQLFPDAFTASAPLSPDAADTVKAASSVGMGRSGTLVRLTLNGRVEVDAESGGATLAPVEVSGPVRWSEGTPEEVERIGANGDYLRSGIEYADGTLGNPVLRTNGPLRPLLIEAGERKALVMPVRLAD